MTRKVELAIFDSDLRVKLGKYEISKDGSKIVVKSGGAGNWTPSFDNESFIEFPKPWYRGGGWKRVYFVKKKGAECVNFSTGKVTGPSEEELKEAIGAVAFKSLGKEDKESTFINYLTLAIAFIILLSEFGVFR